MSIRIRHMLDVHEANIMKNKINDPAYRKASELRMDFVKKFILNINTESYKTQVEKDWAYLAKREYKYLVTYQSAAHSIIAGIMGTFFTTVAQRKFNMVAAIPFAVITPICFMYFKDHYTLKTNKRLFDMCNVGTQYELGHLRNQILRVCNEIQNIEDF